MSPIQPPPPRLTRRAATPLKSCALKRIGRGGRAVVLLDQNPGSRKGRPGSPCGARMLARTNDLYRPSKSLDPTTFQHEVTDGGWRLPRGELQSPAVSQCSAAGGQSSPLCLQAYSSARQSFDRLLRAHWKDIKGRKRERKAAHRNSGSQLFAQSFPTAAPLSPPRSRRRPISRPAGPRSCSSMGAFLRLRPPWRPSPGSRSGRPSTSRPTTASRRPRAWLARSWRRRPVGGSRGRASPRRPSPSSGRRRPVACVSPPPSAGRGR